MSNERIELARETMPGESARCACVQSGAVTVGAATLAGLMTPRVHAGGSDVLKVALIGCGNRGAGAAVQAVSTDGPVKLWAMADAFSDRIEGCLRAVKREIADQHGEERVAELIDVPQDRQFVGLDAYRKVVADVDVVLLCEPPGFRPKHFEFAIEAGKHVFMEKPVATDAPGIRRVLDAGEKAKQAGLKVGVGLQRRHQLCYQQAIERIQNGGIGDVVGLSCYWNGGPPAKSPYPRGDLSEYEFQVRNWYFFDWLSGDHNCEQHVHNIDVCNWIKGAHPTQAQGLGGRQVRTGKEYGNIFDHHDVEFTYAGGTKMFSQCRQIPGCWNQVAEAAYGTQGRAELNANGAQIFLEEKRAWRSPRDRSKRGAYQTEHDVLFDAIRNDKPHYEAEYGAISTMTAIMGRMATYSGRTIRWDEAFASTRTLTTDAESWDAATPVMPDSDGWYTIAMPGTTQVI